MITTPSRESLSAFSSAIDESGVSRTHSTTRMRSFKATCAARVMSVSAMPAAILARVETLQGTITSASWRLLPDENGAARSLSAKMRLTNGSSAEGVSPVSVWSTWRAQSESTRYFSPGQRRMRSTPKALPEAPVMPMR